MPRLRRSLRGLCWIHGDNLVYVPTEFNTYTCNHIRQTRRGEPDSPAKRKARQRRVDKMKADYMEQDTAETIALLHFELEWTRENGPTNYPESTFYTGE